MANKSSLRRHQLERELVFRDVPITVEFGFYEGYEGGPDEPPDSDYIEIDRVLVDDIDVMGLMGQTSFMELLDVLHNEVEKIEGT